jgi:hypothetical protein
MGLEGIAVVAVVVVVVVVVFCSGVKNRRLRGVMCLLVAPEADDGANKSVQLFLTGVFTTFMFSSFIVYAIIYYCSTN